MQTLFANCEKLTICVISLFTPKKMVQLTHFPKVFLYGNDTGSDMRKTRGKEDSVKNQRRNFFQNNP
jgi:hypothetical protein